MQLSRPTSRSTCRGNQPDDDP